MNRSPDQSPDQEMLDRWERRESAAYAFVPYLTLAAAYLLTVLVGGQSPSVAYATTGLTVAAALWVLWMVTLHPEWVHRRRLMGLYYTALVALMAALVLCAPWFGLFTFAGYLHAIQVLHGRWRTVGVMTTAVVTATSQDAGLPKGGIGALIGYLVIVLLNLLLGAVIMWFGWISQEQNNRRERANEELAEANRKLTASLEENRDLHALLLAQAREAGVLDERRRLAQEIHDTLAQGLIGIITQLQAAEQARRRADGEFDGATGELGGETGGRAGARSSDVADDRADGSQDGAAVGQADRRLGSEAADRMDGEPGGAAAKQAASGTNIGVGGAVGAASTVGTAGPAGIVSAVDALAAVGTASAAGPADTIGAVDAVNAVVTLSATSTMGTFGTADVASAAGSVVAASAVDAVGAIGASGAVDAVDAADAASTIAAVGTVGTAGPTGTVGAVSAAGPAGAADAVGTLGAASAVGVVGAVDAVNAAGAAGTIAAVDAVDAAGPASAAGSVGAASAIGAADAVSAAGPTGTASTADAVDAVGAASTAGAAGTVGAADTVGAGNAAGAAGAVGAVGAVAAAGTASAAGAAGTVGAVGAAGRTSEPSPRDEERRHLAAAAQLARDSLSEARRSVRALQPEQLESAGLSEALAGVAARWSALNLVPAEFSITGTVCALHPEIEATILRTAQEALANVAKHAKATRVGLTLSYMDDQVTLDVRDDGVGFDPSSLAAHEHRHRHQHQHERGHEDGHAQEDGHGSGSKPGSKPGPKPGNEPGSEPGQRPDGGFGLTAMRQRVDRLTGRLDIESEPGGGTAVSASLPAVSATGALR